MKQIKCPLCDSEYLYAMYNEKCEGPHDPDYMSYKCSNCGTIVMLNNYTYTKLWASDTELEE